MTPLATFSAGFLLVFFAILGSVKVWRWHRKLVSFQLGLFAVYGLSSRTYTLIGCLELAAAVGFALPGILPIGLLAGGGIALLSVAAFAFHARYDKVSFGLPAILSTLFGSVVFAKNWQQWSATSDSRTFCADAMCGLHLPSGTVEVAAAVFGGAFALSFFRIMLTKIDVGPAVRAA